MICPLGGPAGGGYGFAGLILRPILLLFCLRVLLLDFDVLVAGKRGAGLVRRAIRRGNLYQLGFRRDRLRDMAVKLRLVASRVGALCGIWANRKSFLLAPRRHASQSGRYPVRIRAAVWEAAAANERLGPLTGLWFESVAARSTR